MRLFEDLTEQDRAGSLILAESCLEGPIRPSKNSDSLKGYTYSATTSILRANSRGRHENYLLHRRRERLPPGRRRPRLLLHDPSDPRRQRQDSPALRAALSFSQRAEQMWTWSPPTTRSRPIINTRDEPSPIRSYRRMHVIVGDTNAAEPTSALKIGMTELLAGRGKTCH